MMIGDGGIAVGDGGNRNGVANALPALEVALLPLREQMIQQSLRRPW
jgi:hypothetical protein